MNDNKTVVGVLIEDATTFSYTEICHQYQIPEEFLIEMIEYGVFPVTSFQKEHIALDAKSLKRLESAFRLHRDLDINVPGVALAVELLEEVEKMRCELDILRKHF
jgi:chaperone modulatory protein CbpM